ncbi:hypothetical protein [Pseudocolwellia agarivorans]|uniref:hypothetical protein n=1 Tax=Pseudocolwellia agarivorans TaxID=1911682 RepID=UPI00098414B4|nr:hypothetical protein [Pseudocolwellia agarivorans]
MNKKNIIQHVLQHLSTELKTTELAANNAHLAAIDDQSIAETQYDTVAIEAGYLAEGQSKRVDEIKNSIALFEQFHARELKSSPTIVIGSLVQLEKGITNNNWLFIAPAAGGFRCVLEENNITVITPHSPMGQALINKEVDDEVSLLINGLTTTENIDYIHSII